MKLNFKNIKTSIISITVGKKYLISIVQKYLPKISDEILKEINHLILTINDNKNVDYFNLHNELRSLLYSEELQKELNTHTLSEFDNFMRHFVYHSKNTLTQLENAKKTTKKQKRTIHNYFKLSPQEPDIYENITDYNATYNSIISKLYLKKYNKYVLDTDNGGGAWTFQLCMTYLILIDKLYRLLEDKIEDTKTFLFSCIKILNPIVTSLTYITKIDFDDVNSFALMYELMQLTSSGSYLTIKKNWEKFQIEFIFTTEKGAFTHSGYESNKAGYRRDNYGKRKVKLIIFKDGKDLFAKIDLVGLQVIQDITGLACDKALFSINTDEFYLEAVSYNVIATILSHTKEFKIAHKKAIEDAQKWFNSNKNKYFISNEHLIESAQDALLRKTPFSQIQQEKLLKIFQALQKEFKLQKNNVFYYRFVASGINMTRSEISQMLQPIASKQQALIRKMIKFAKNYRISDFSALSNLYKEVTYRG